MNAPRRHPLAKADIEREARWYDAQQPGLGTDFVDIYRLTRVDPAVPIEDTIGAIADMVKKGIGAYLKDPGKAP